MKKNDILENIFIEKLIFGGKGLAIAPDGRKILITGGVIPKSVVNLRVLKAKKSYLEAQLLETVQKSPLEQNLPDHYQVYGGCKWLPIAYEEQLTIKAEQVKEAFHTLQKYWGISKKTLPNESMEDEKEEQLSDTPVGIGTHFMRTPPLFHDIVASPEIYGYRNKIEFSWGKYISFKEGIHDEFRFGFHAQAQFDRIINCDFCVLADDEVNALFKEMDTFSRESGLPTYDPKTNQGFWRHFVVRKAHFTNEIMLILSVNHEFEGYNRTHEARILSFIKNLAQKFPHIVSVYLLENSGRADIVTGNALCIYGKATITEQLLGKTFEINPKSFFQTNSLGAEKLYGVVRDLMKSDNGVLLDLYAGTGTMGILLADRFEQVYSVELVSEASKDGAKNAGKNGVSNITFINEKTEKFLPKFLEENVSIIDTSLIIDPPRDGMHPDALPQILKFNAKEIIYVSCNPATLARDLDYILMHSLYRVSDVVPVDMFPHTHHIETVVRLEKHTS